MTLLKTRKSYIYLELTYKNRHQLFTSAHQALNTLNSVQKGTTEDIIKVHIEKDCPELKLEKDEVYLLADLLPRLPYNTKIVLHYGFYNNRRRKIKYFKKSSVSQNWRFA